eukprot:15467018-Alexandrium_andersonii.AAC.1
MPIPYTLGSWGVERWAKRNSNRKQKGRRYGKVNKNANAEGSQAAPPRQRRRQERRGIREVEKGERANYALGMNTKQRRRVASPRTAQRCSSRCDSLKAAVPDMWRRWGKRKGQGNDACSIACGRGRLRRVSTGAHSARMRAQLARANRTLTPWTPR